MNTLTPIQQLILQAFVIEPEDRTAFKRARKAAASRAYYSANKVSAKESRRAYYLANREGITERNKAYAKSHPEQKKETCRRYREANRARIAETQHIYEEENSARVKASKRKWAEEHPGYWREYMAKRLATDPEFRLKQYCRTRIYGALKGGKKCARTAALIGCSIPGLKAHLEAQFRPGMTWENYGPVWHVDHIRPCASFELLNPEQQLECFHWSNLQPLFAAENIRKGDKIE